MSALVRQARSALTYTVAGLIGGGRRVPHAPAPTRYRFGIQGADNKAALLKPLPGEPWTASAWIRSSLTTNAGGTKPNGGADEDALWKVLWDIRLFAERLEKLANQNSTKLEKVGELVKERKPPLSPRKMSTTVLLAAAAFVVSYVSYERLSQSITLAKSVELLNKVATDPRTKETIEMYLVMLTDVIKGAFNPLGSFWSREVQDQSFSTLVEKEAAIAEKILLVILLDNGPTTDRVVQNLKAVGSEDPIAVITVLISLLKSGYADIMVDQRKEYTYWPSKKTLEESKSGKLKSNLKALIKDKVTVDLKAKVKVPGEEKKDSK